MWRPWRSVLGLSLLLVTTSWSSIGLAQRPSPTHYPDCEHVPTESDISAAKGAYKAGQVSFQEADYERALLYWEDAFRRDCTAIKLLLNIARAYELSEDRASAVVALETYLERDPGATDRASVEKRIAKLNEKLEQARPSEVTLASPPPRVEEEAKEPAEAHPISSEPPRRPTWPVVLTAGGVASLAVGATLTILGAIDVGNEKDAIAREVVLTDDDGNVVRDSEGNALRCTRKGLEWTCPEDLLDDVQAALNSSDELRRAKTMRTVGIVVTASGAVLTGVGAYFWYKLWKVPNAEAATRLPVVAPVLTPRFAGISFSGRF